VDIVSSFLLISLLGGPRFDSFMTDEQVKAAMQVLLQDTRYLTSTLILGTASTVLGGFLAARFARSVPYFNALAFGLLGLVVSVFTVDDVPTWFKIIGFALTLPAALLGGYFAKLRSQPGRS
jgi:CBS domain containing-hemolysin-like protein